MMQNAIQPLHAVLPDKVVVNSQSLFGEIPDRLPDGKQIDQLKDLLILEGLNTRTYSIQLQYILTRGL